MPVWDYLFTSFIAPVPSSCLAEAMHFGLIVSRHLEGLLRKDFNLFIRHFHTFTEDGVILYHDVKTMGVICSISSIWKTDCLLLLV